MKYKYINTDYLDSVSGGDTQIILEIVALFREQVVEIFNEMESLFAEKKFSSLGLLAHKAKSSVAIMGMADLAAMLKQFELEAKEGIRTEEYRSYIDRFRSDTGEAVRELDDLIRNKS